MEVYVLHAVPGRSRASDRVIMKRHAADSMHMAMHMHIPALDIPSAVGAQLARPVVDVPPSRWSMECEKVESLETKAPGEGAAGRIAF
jgi:hypothetical protein